MEAVSPPISTGECAGISWNAGLHNLRLCIEINYNKKFIELKGKRQMFSIKIQLFDLSGPNSMRVAKPKPCQLMGLHEVLTQL